MIEHPRYTIGEALGRGAQGTVRCVVDREAPDRPLVAKSLRAASAGAIAELEGEFAVLSRVRIPGLVRVHDLARDVRDGTPFLVEERVDGVTAEAFVGRDVGRFVLLAASLAETLALLHDAGFVHGDVKPANLRVTERAEGDFRVVLFDLGATTAIHRDARARIYTPAFAAPELLGGARPSAQTDLYALGATLFAVASSSTIGPRDGALRSRPPIRGRDLDGAFPPLADVAPWIPPSVARVVDALVAVHPADRPRNGREVLFQLGRSGRGAAWEGASSRDYVREPELGRVRDALAASRVVFVTGPAGVGKSHLAREIATRMLLEGRAIRTVRFPDDEGAANARLLAFLRGAAPAPFATSERESAGPGLLLVLDDLERAPPELRSALDLFRSREARGETSLAILATSRAAPPASAVVTLAPLDRLRFGALARSLAPERDAEHLFREAAGLPGWLVAAIGRVPLTRDLSTARLATVGARDRLTLATLAIAGGALPVEVLEHASVGRLLAAGLVDRDGANVSLGSPGIATSLADALADETTANEALARGLGSDAVAADALLAISLTARAVASARGDEALATRADEAGRLAAERARLRGARSLEIDALLALLARAEARETPHATAQLLRLERLLRDAGLGRAHPEVVGWLEECAARDPRLEATARRRRAEERARAGDREGARANADAARAAAERSGDPRDAIYAHATRGAVALFAAAWEDAANAFREAATLRDTLPAATALDGEEIARLDHNHGVVLLYRGRYDEAARAFEDAAAIKRSLGDAGGVRACLLNLGLANAKAGNHEEAASALEEATRLALALGQPAGHAWCLAARADLAVRRARPREAEGLVAEADAIGGAIPAPVRVDLAILRVQIAILDGDGAGAIALLATMADADRALDALVRSRVTLLEAQAHLATLPVDRRRASRLAIAAIRLARIEGLVEIEGEGLATLRRARGGAPPAPMTMPDPTHARDADEVSLLATLAREPTPVALHAFATHLVRTAGAERVLVAAVDADGKIASAWGADVDGLPIAEAARRLDPDVVGDARRAGVAHHPTITFATGSQGARLVVGGIRVVVVLEHRYRPHAFDTVDTTTTARWAILGDLVARLASTHEGAPSSTAGARGASSPSAGGAPALEASPALARDDRSATDETTHSTAVSRREPVRAFPTIVGRSSALLRALADLDRAVDTDLPVLVHGETGTGKELFCRALHDHGRRARAPFVAVNCAALPEALFEAELFGHARGAFTGADRARPGLLAKAEGGTLLLDEIGELALPRQAALLRVLETRRYRPVGSDDERAFDVRIIAATNRDLEAAVADGTFRSDLLYRLRVLEIQAPPLRARHGDVGLLARHFLARAGSRATLTEAAVAALDAYAFPGNVRELAHHVERLALRQSARIDVGDLPRAIRAQLRREGSAAHAGLASGSGSAADLSETDATVRALAATAGNISRAANLLGITRHGLKKRMLRLGLRAKASAEGSMPTDDAEMPAEMAPPEPTREAGR